MINIKDFLKQNLIKQNFKRMKNIINLLAILYCSIIYCQVGIGTTNPNRSSALDITSSDKGLLLPRLNLISTTKSGPLLSHVAGMMIYNLGNNEDVKPGYYINDGSKWQSITDAIQTINDQQTTIENLGNQVPIKRAVFIAGQSNTHNGEGNAIIPDFSGKNLSQLGRKSPENFQIIPLTFYGTHHHTNLSNHGSFGSIFLYHYYNKLQEDFPNREIQLILIPCGKGGSGWLTDRGNTWRASDVLWSDLITRIKWIKNNGYQIDAFLWHQGETDAKSNTKNYKDVLKNFIQSVRDYAGNQNLPFILGEMAQSWVTNNHESVYQDIINSIPNEVPYTATTSSTELTLGDEIHFDASSHVELGSRYFDNLDIAKKNTSPADYSNPAVGQHLIYNFDSSKRNVFPDEFSAIRYGENEEDDRYSVLGDIWKYKNKDGYFRFKLVVVNGGLITDGVFEWKQKINPFGLSKKNFEDLSSCIILSNSIGLDTSINGNGFNSLVCDSFTGKTLFHGDTQKDSDKWFFSIGQISNYSNKIPLIEGDVNNVTHVQLYCIKE